MAKRALVAAMTAPVALVGCHSSSEEDLPSDPPSSVTQVASGGFTSPTEAVASLDGKTFYFAAYDEEKEPAIFEVAAEPGSTALPLVVGAPLTTPIGLVLSCDGANLYVADAGGDEGSLFSLATAGGALSDLSAAGIHRPGGIAMGPDCKTLYATGRTSEGAPALFAIPTSGASVTVVYQGEPLVSPTGVHVDNDGTAWVMDHLAHGASGEGVLFAIPSDGSAATEVVSDLRMGTPGGVSLTAGGGVAVMPTRTLDGGTQLTSVTISTGERTELATPDIQDVGGLRTARKAGVFAVVDTEAGAIYRAD